MRFQPLFPGESGVDQLVEIIKVLLQTFSLYLQSFSVLNLISSVNLSILAGSGNPNQRGN